MKIGFVITLSTWGGAQVHLFELAKNLINQGHDCFVVIGEEGELSNTLKSIGIKTIILESLVREINPVKDLKCTLDLYNIFKKEKPDIIHLHSSKAGLVGRISAKLNKIPVIFTAHGWAFTEGVSKVKGRIFLFLERFAAKISNKIICVSEFDRQLAIKNNVGNSEILVTIHNGVESRTKNIENRDNKIPKLIMVARFSAQKDYETLTLALSKVNGDFEIQYVGVGELMPKIKSLVAENHLETRVKFLGMRKDVLNLLEQANIFILSSNYEGLPISIIEAMAAKLPIIATNVGGVNELVEDNKNGFLTHRKDYDELATKIQSLIDNPELCKKMGQASYEKYESDFTISAMLNKTFKVYEEVLANN
jgi:glycosyltransferase involved in cell wall biosynthesis